MTSMTTTEEAGTLAGTAPLATRRRRGAWLREPVWRGLAGVVGMFLLVGLWHVLVLPPYKPLDEPRHAAYSIALADGRLPTVRDELPAAALEMKPLSRSNIVASANHPPLYYALVMAPIAVGSATHHMELGIKLARLMTLLMAAGGLVFVFRALRQLTPARPALALAATAFTAAGPAYVNCSAAVMNDALAFLATAAVYDSAFAILFRGPARRRWFVYGAWLAVAALSRFTTLLAIAPAVLAVALGILLHDRRERTARLARAALACVASAGVIALASGYFYYRNYRLYGDVTGSKELFEILSRKQNAPFLEQIVTGKLWLDLSDQLWNRLAGGVSLKGFAWTGRALLLVAGVGALKALFDRRRDFAPGNWHAPRWLAAALLMLGYLFVTLPIFEYHARGGGFHARYSFTMVWAAWLFVAVGLAGFQSHFVLRAGVLLASVQGLMVTSTYLGKIAGSRGSDFGLFRGFDKAGVPWPEVSATVMLALFCAALTVVLRQIRALETAPNSANTSLPGTPP